MTSIRTPLTEAADRGGRRAVGSAPEDGVTFGLGQLRDQLFRRARRPPRTTLRGGTPASRSRRAPGRDRSGERVVGVGPQVVNGPRSPVGFGDQTRELGRHVLARGQGGDARGPRLPAARRDRRLGEVIDHEAAVGHRGRRPTAASSWSRADQQVVDEATLRPPPGARRRPSGAQQPSGIGLVLHEAADADEPLAADGRASEPVELLADVGRGEVDVADDAADRAAPLPASSSSSSVSATSATVWTTTVPSMPRLPRPRRRGRRCRSGGRMGAMAVGVDPRLVRARRGPTRGGGRRPGRVTSTVAPTPGRPGTGTRRSTRRAAAPRRPAPSGPGSARPRRRTGSVKCSWRWSTYSIHRPSIVPLTATKSNIARCCTISHRPTPPACGHTGTPNLAASSRMARFSLTPPTRQASICTTSMASAWSSCLKITRFWTCSPVATRIGLHRVADRAMTEHVVG